MVSSTGYQNQKDDYSGYKNVRGGCSKTAKCWNQKQSIILKVKATLNKDK